MTEPASPLLDGKLENKASLFSVHLMHCGPGSSVGIATDYGLDCPGSNPG